MSRKYFVFEKEEEWFDDADYSFESVIKADNPVDALDKFIDKKYGKTYAKQKDIIKDSSGDYLVIAEKNINKYTLNV